MGGLHSGGAGPLDRGTKADPVRSALGYCGAQVRTGSKDYHHGFHLFADFADAVYLAESYSDHFPGAGIVVKRVHYRGLICSGDGGGGRREIVVDEIFVPSETEWTVMPRGKVRVAGASDDPLEEIALRLLRELQPLADGNADAIDDRVTGSNRSGRRLRR